MKRGTGYLTSAVITPAARKEKEILRHAASARVKKKERIHYSLQVSEQHFRSYVIAHHPRLAFCCRPLCPSPLVTYRLSHL